MPLMIAPPDAAISYSAGTSDLVFSTFLGGSSIDEGTGIAVDSEGSVYVTGTTNSADFPIIPGGFTAAGRIFVCKLDPTGSSLIYVALLGGNDSSEAPFDVTVDATGNAYISGMATDGVPITTGAFQTSFGGATDVFLAKLNATGSALLYSTYLGGSDTEFCANVAVDANGYAYVTGTTYSPDFPTTPAAFDRTHNGPGTDDAFIAKLNPAGTALVYSTFLGGSSLDSAYAIALDEFANAYISGRTHSADFPLSPGAADSTYSGLQDVFIAKLNNAGTGLVYATYLGGSNWEGSGRLAVDPSGNCYVTGWTESTDFPVTTDAYDMTYNGGRDTFMARINATGTRFTYATYLGGSEVDEAEAIAADSTG